MYDFIEIKSNGLYGCLFKCPHSELIPYSITTTNQIDQYYITEIDTLFENIKKSKLLESHTIKFKEQEWKKLCFRTKRFKL